MTDFKLCSNGSKCISELLIKTKYSNFSSKSKSRSIPMFLSWSQTKNMKMSICNNWILINYKKEL